MLSRRLKSSQEAIRILYQPGFEEEIEEKETVAPTASLKAMDSNPIHETPCPDYIVKGKGPTMGLIEARTDVDLTDLRRHNAGEGPDEPKMVHVHPLALMCQ